MKTTTIIAALAGITLFAFDSSALAQYKATGDEGITASPKARQFINEYNENHNFVPVPDKITQMSCPKCKDRVIETRGTYKAAFRVVGHQCKGCGTDWAVTGIGKTKQAIATHKCSACGSENLACCNLSKDDTTATKGMERDVKIAPLK